MKKIINILLRILDCITLRGIVEKPKTYTPDRVKYVEDTQDHIQIPLNGRSLEDLKITINDEVFDLKSGFGDVVNGVEPTITTTYTPRVKYVEDYPHRLHPPKNRISKNPPAKKRFDEWGDNWSVYSEDDEELLEDIKNNNELRESSTPFPAVYKLDNGDYDVYIEVEGMGEFGYYGFVFDSNETKNYPVGRYSDRWNPAWMSKVENYGKEE